MGLVQQAESVMTRLKSRALERWRGNPLFVVLWLSFSVAGASTMLVSQGSRWDSFLTGAAWWLLITTGIVGLIGGRGTKRLE